MIQKYLLPKIIHIGFELCDRSRDLLGISYTLALALGTGEPVKA